VDRETVDVYEAGAAHYLASRRANEAGATAFASSLPPGVVRVDLGCGPGHDADLLGSPLVSLDASAAMHATAGGLRVQADLGALPFRRGSLGGAWASKSYQHVPHEELPLALADLHRSLVVGAPLGLSVFAGSGSVVTGEDEDLPGRRFALWSPDDLVPVVEGAGFEVTGVDVGAGEWPHLRLSAVRARSLPDTVGPGMRLLLCGLNPSLYAADLGVGYARPGNRFWPALLAAGLATVDRDPWHLLRVHRIGMTDLVKRATVAAAEVTPEEFAAGVERVQRLCAWLRPGAVYLVGLQGWRAAVDRRATVGWQERTLGGVPLYVGPSTSGLNASTQLAGHVEHLLAASSFPPSG
jgi:double-stranded uracil-DNA glycosylase